MTSTLLPYFEHELLFIRKMAAEFAERYPDRAGALKLSEDGSEDPHVERLIEAFALIAGRIQCKIDDEFPEITEALLDFLYPHYVRPVPSMAIAQFQMDPEQRSQAMESTVDRGTMLCTPPASEAPCRFRTCYPVKLLPLQINSAAFVRAANLVDRLAGLDVPYAIRLEVQCLGGAKWQSLGITSLRFFLDGDPQVAHILYELLFKNTNSVLIRFAQAKGQKKTVKLPANAIRPIGFNHDEAMLPYSDRSFQGYRLLQEYFSFPRKFLFFELGELEALSLQNIPDRVEIVILVNEFQRNERMSLLEQGVGTNTFQLNCTPLINLFERCAEPIRISHTETEYRIIPDVHSPHANEVYSVSRVVSVAPSEEPTEYRPFYSFRHSEGERGREAYWHAVRRRSERNNDAGTEVFLGLVDMNFEPISPPAEALTVHVTCTNRDLPARWSMNGTWGELEVESGSLLRVRALHGPTKTLRTPLRRGLQWKLISHLALNHLSIVEGGLEALRELLKLYNFSESPAVARQISGVTGIQSRRKMARVNSDYGFVFCQGIHVDLEFDEEEYAGSGAFLLACVLERFFGLYCALNSFSQLSVSTRQRKGVAWVWPPRTGEQIVL